jgi:hypothetical protein
MVIQQQCVTEKLTLGIEQRKRPSGLGINQALLDERGRVSTPTCEVGHDASSRWRRKSSRRTCPSVGVTSRGTRLVPSLVATLTSVDTVCA